MQKFLQNRLAQRAVAIGLLSAPLLSHAAIDTTAVTLALTEAGAAIAVVGAAFLSMTVGTKVFKWIKSAL
jgi:hypothetical protein